MKAFKYVTYTWLLAQLIQVIVFLFLGINSAMVGSFLLASFISSIPSFLICLLFFQILFIIKAPIAVSFIVWSMLVYASIAANFCGIGLLIGDTDLLFEDLKLAFPPFIAATLALLIRFNQFEELLITQTIVNEN